MNASLDPDIERQALAYHPPIEEATMPVTATIVDGMFVSRRPYPCHYCQDVIAPGERHRVLAENLEEQPGAVAVSMRRWCPACVLAMAHGPAELDARREQGARRQAEAASRIEFEEYRLVEWTPPAPGGMGTT